MKRVAPEEPAGGLYRPAEETISLDDAGGVMRAGWLKAAAVGKKRRHAALVEEDRQEGREHPEVELEAQDHEEAGGDADVVHEGDDGARREARAEAEGHVDQDEQAGDAERVDAVLAQLGVHARAAVGTPAACVDRSNALGKSLVLALSRTLASRSPGIVASPRHSVESAHRRDR